MVFYISTRLLVSKWMFVLLWLTQNVKENPENYSNLKQKKMRNLTILFGFWFVFLQLCGIKIG